jgi:predicted DNA-binding transcriptional regulator AlpA
MSLATQQPKTTIANLLQGSAVFNEREMSRYIGVSIATLDRWRKAGEGPKWGRLGKKLIRYLKTHADAYLESPDCYHPPNTVGNCRCEITIGK